MKSYLFLIAIILSLNASSINIFDYEKGDIFTLENSTFEILDKSDACIMVSVSNADGTYYEVFASIMTKSLPVIVPIGVKYGCLALVKNKFVCDIVAGITAVIIDMALGSVKEQEEHNVAWVAKKNSKTSTANVKCRDVEIAKDTFTAFNQYKKGGEIEWNTKMQNFRDSLILAN